MKILLLYICICFSFLNPLKGQKMDSCQTVILYLVDKKGIETGEIRKSGCVNPCKGSYTVPIEKTFLGKRETYYDDCSGKWIKIEYYFLGRRTRTRKNPAFDNAD